jgi:hypothetical protein
MKFKDGGSAIIRFAKPGVNMFPEEKVRNEVAAIRYIHEHTTIPVPFILHWGTKDESPLGLGPFIIMDYIDHVKNLSAALNTPGFAREDRPILDPQIDAQKLEVLYGQVADILLELNKLSPPQIGSVAPIDHNGSWGVEYRPLTMNMNELVRVGTFPRSKLPKPSATFETTSSYFDSLADQHIGHLTHQRNDAIDSADDCRQRYVARQLFRRLARSRQLTSPAVDLGPFKIWCDDLRPSNILINEDLQIVGVVDWEFTYSAPVEFTHAPPWWLLLEQPEYWPDGIKAWTKVYESRLQTFLRVLQDREDMAIRQSRLKEEQRLSSPMRKSWESGEFWIVYAARKSFAFDSVFWKELDTRFFGTPKTEGDWKGRMELLTQQERADMVRLVERKMEEMKTRVLAWEPEELDPPENSSTDKDSASVTYKRWQSSYA